MADSIELLNLRLAQQGQIIEQYRTSLYNTELRLNLLIKMMEEKGLFVPGEHEKRWPLYLKNDIGVIGPEGIMEGTLKITIFDK